MKPLTDEHYMTRALELAAKGRYTTAPNPCVGCVIVKDGVIVGEGWHQKAGAAHAEVTALAEAGAQARGSDCFVTLEPCCHTGRTGPCADALIQAGVKRLIVAMQDPNPKVSGGGLARLQSAGIETTLGVLQADAMTLNRGFVKRMQQGLPWVTAKVAMSLDGRTAMANGESQWITGVEARQDGHRLRAQSGAVLTGIGTVLQDDPQLTVRALETGRQPLRVVLDSCLRLPPTANILKGDAPTLIVTRVKRFPSFGASVQCVTCPSTGEDKLDLHWLLRFLAREYEVNEVLVEAGQVLNGAFLSEDLLDEGVFYLAPKVLGDQSHGVFHTPEMAYLTNHKEVMIKEVCSIGQDLRITISFK